MIQALLRENIKNLMPYRSARSEFQGNAKILLDANENPYDWPFSRYPDPLATKLKQKICSLKQISTDQIFIGNGSDEAIDLLIRAFCQPGIDNIRVLDPSYGMYEVSASINDIGILRSELSSTFGLDPNFSNTNWTQNEKILFLCSPNNPSGNSFDPSLIKEVITSYPGIVVVDEAYIDFADSPSALSLINDFENLVVIQTLSKASGSAGIRIGMAYAQMEIIEVLNRIKPPYNVSQIAQEAAINLLENQILIQNQIEEIKQQRQLLKDELIKLQIVQEVFPSQANFLLVRVIDANQTYDFLANREIVVRKRHGMLHCNQSLRITIGTPSENQKLLKALKMYENETRN